MHTTDLGQSFQDQSCLGSLAVLLVGFSLQPHLLSLRLPHSFNGGSLSFTDAADLLGLCLCGQHLPYPGGGLENHHKVYEPCAVL